MYQCMVPCPFRSTFREQMKLASMIIDPQPTRPQCNHQSPKAQKEGPLPTLDDDGGGTIDRSPLDPQSIQYTVVVMGRGHGLRSYGSDQS